MDKIKSIREYYPSFFERSMYAEYLWAVYRNKTETIAKYEAFGKHIRQIMYNMHCYKRGLLFGFKERGFNEHGWIEKVKWLNYEEIRLDDKESGFLSNGVRIGMGLNGKWAFSINYSFGASGGSGPLCEFSEIEESRALAIETGLLLLQEKHTNALTKTDDSCNYNASLIKKILAKIKDKLSYKNEQLTLFDI